MIIYALIIIAALFFLAWNLISQPRLHFIASLVTTLLFTVAITFAVANFSYHYGMHRVNEPQRTRRINSLSPLSSLKMISYKPMGPKRSEQLVIYKNAQKRTRHTAPDLKVKNRIVKRLGGSKAYVVTRISKWKYRNSWDESWFDLAKKPSVTKEVNVFYIPKSWQVLSEKQSLAFKQIIKNRMKQLKQRDATPQAKQRMKAKASEYVKQQMASSLGRHPNMSAADKKRVVSKAMRSFKMKVQRRAKDHIMVEALQTAKTIH